MSYSVDGTRFASDLEPTASVLENLFQFLDTYSHDIFQTLLILILVFRSQIHN